MTALIHAAMLEEKDALVELVARGANVHCESASHQTALTAAAAGGKLAAITALVTRCGAAVDHETAKGDTALMMAARSGQAQAARLLLSHGAQVTKENAVGVTALAAAVEAADPFLVRVALTPYLSAAITS